MTTPSLVVDIGFDDGPLVASPTWTAVTSYVLASPGVSISRGRNTEFDQATSTATFTLDNRSRLFDPTNTAGTYYGKLLPRRPVRIRATWNAVTYDLFRGVVEGWPQTLPNTVESTVTVRCIDLLAVLGETELEDAAFVYAEGTGHLNGALRTMVNGLWYDDVGGYVMRRRAGLVASETSFAKGPGTAVDVTNAWYSVNDFYADRGVGFESVGNTTGSVSFWIKAPVAPVPSYEEAVMGTVTNSAIVTRISLLNGKVRYVGSGTTTPIKQSLYRVDDEAWHHVAVTIDGSTQVIYVDGQDVTSSVASSSSTFQGINVIGKVQWTSSASNWVDSKATIQDVWTFDDALTATEVLDLYELGKGEKLESTAARFGRVCDAGDVPAGLRSATSVPQGEVLEIDLFGNIAQSELQTVADSEYGRMFVSRDGKITLHDRFWWKTQTRGNTVQVTFSDAPGAGEYKFSGVGFDLSDREVANKVTVTGSAGLRHTSEDATSQTAFGVERTSQSTILSRNSLVESLADGILALRKDAVLRMDAIEVRAQGDTASWPSVLDRELGDRFKIEVKPANTGTQQNVELLLERIEWSIRGGEWVGRFTGAPVPNYSLFILDSSILNGTDKLGF